MLLCQGMPLSRGDSGTALPQITKRPLSLLLRAGMLLTVGEPGGLEVRVRADPLKFGSLLSWQIRPLVLWGVSDRSAGEKGKVPTGLWALTLPPSRS